MATLPRQHHSNNLSKKSFDGFGGYLTTFFFFLTSGIFGLLYNVVAMSTVCVDRLNHIFFSCTTNTDNTMPKELGEILIFSTARTIFPFSFFSSAHITSVPLKYATTLFSLSLCTTIFFWSCTKGTLSREGFVLGWHQNKKRGQCPCFWGISDPPLPPPKRGHFWFFFPLFFAGFWVTGCKFVTQNTVFWHFRNPSRKWWGQSRKLDNFLTT